MQHFLPLLVVKWHVPVDAGNAIQGWQLHLIFGSEYNYLTK
ncbi:Uncharacterised protein [Legionella pneumophila]|nr:Uncharacterised protein [Legionella pneumophila]